MYGMNNFKIAMNLIETNVKCKVVPVHATKASGEAGVQLRSFLTLAVDGCEWLASRPGRFTPGESDPDGL
jgi:hypothetical protein